jgi:diguanylate cyclase (GGDEF)-like protein/PAS domain S-box-containing protein
VNTIPKQRLDLLRSHRALAAGRSQFAARAGAALFAAEAVLILAAAAIGGVLRTETTALLVASALACCLAAVLLVAYRHLGALGMNVVALGGNASVTILIATPELGMSYRILYIWLILWVAFFLPRWHAIFQVAAIAAASGIVLLDTAPLAEVAQLWVLSTGLLAGAAAITMVVRGQLVGAIATAQRTGAMLDAFFINAPAGFGFLDHDLRHVRVNQALAEIMGHERDEIEGRTLRELAPINGDVLEPLARSVLASGTAVLGIEIDSSEGHCHLVSYYPVPGAGVAGVGTAVTDVTHLKDVERRLEETNRRLTVLATTDELTQLPNRRMLDEQLELALARARRGGLAVAVLNVDLDHFKEVNDSLGHAYGDRLLVEVAGCLRAGARETDVVARVGGDEFVILLADLDVQEAPQLAQTVVDRIADVLSEPLAIDPVELRVEASIGVAIYPTDSRDAKGLLAIADAAMYAGKPPLANTA